MKKVLGFIKRAPKQLLNVLVYLFTLKWITGLIEFIKGVTEERRRGKQLENVRKGVPVRCSPKCAVIRPDVYKRPDPLIYSQKYLREQGLSVTWDNPDIQLFKDGNPVSSSNLEANTEYQVVATIYNNSTEAPAVNMPVEFTYLSFGVGTESHPIGTDHVDLPVKGAPGHPTEAKINWRTPAEEGHYCLQVDLHWSDDANPKNNLGQENTNVGSLSSPAVFEFPVRNNDKISKKIHMTIDDYEIPERLDCKKLEKRKQKTGKRDRLHKSIYTPYTEKESDWVFARNRHGYQNYEISQGWSVSIDPEEFVLDPGDQVMVKVSLEPVEEFTGRKSFNVSAWYGKSLLGGVTLIVTS